MRDTFEFERTDAPLPSHSVSLSVEEEGGRAGPVPVEDVNGAVMGLLRPDTGCDCEGGVGAVLNILPATD